MDNIENKQITQEDLKKFSEILEESLGEGADFDIIKSLGSLLVLSDEDFLVLAPGLMQTFQQSVNNPNDKVLLTQSLNASGATAEELVQSFGLVAEEIDRMDEISQVKRDFIKGILATLTNAINETEGIAKRMVQLPIELCRPDAKMPQYANTSDSGMDVYALEEYTILPGETMLVPTGFKMAIPPGYEIQVRPKSGCSLRTKLRLPNTPGTIDAGYRDEIQIILENVDAAIRDIEYHFVQNEKTGSPEIVVDSILHGSPLTIGKGEKFVQLVLAEVPKAALYQVESVQEIGKNRGGGFGSTGLK